MAGVAQLFKISRQGAQGNQPGADGRGALQKSRRGLFKVELNRQRIDDFATIVVINHLGHRQAVRFIAETVGIKVFGNCIGVKRGAIRKGDARANLKGIFGFIRVGAPAFGNPRFDL